MKFIHLFTPLSKRACLLALSCSLGLVSCDSSSSSSDSTTAVSESSSEGVDPQLQSFVDNFVEDMNERGIFRDISGLSVSFAELDDGIAGICIPSQGTVIISPIFRDSTNNLEELIYHELGHCVLGMEHRDDSIMQDRGFIGINAATINEFFSPEFFDEFDVNTSSTREIKFF